MAKTEVFQKWIKTESSRKAGELDDLEHKIDMELIKNTKVERRDADKWVEDGSLSIDAVDLLLFKE